MIHLKWLNIWNGNTSWLTQKEMARLFDVSTDNIGLHIKNILKDNELDKSTTEKSSEVRLEGNRKVRRKVLIYNLDMIISVGCRVKTKHVSFLENRSLTDNIYYLEIMKNT